MKRLLLLLISVLLVVGCQGKQSKGPIEEPFYIGLQMGITYKMFLHEKQPIDGGIRYKFRTRVEYSSDTPTRINDWQFAETWGDKKLTSSINPSPFGCWLPR